MDDRIRQKTGGAKSLRDGLRWLLRWSAENRKPFDPQDLPRYFATATGVDTADRLAHWRPPPDAPHGQVKQLKVTILSTMLADKGICEWIGPRR